MLRILKFIRKSAGLIMRLSLVWMVVSLLVALFTSYEFQWISFIVFVGSMFTYVVVFMIAINKLKYMKQNEGSNLKKEFQKQYKAKMKIKR